MSDLTVSIAFLLSLKHQILRDIVKVKLFNPPLHLDHFFNLLQEPDIDLRLLHDRFERNSQFYSIVDMEQAVPTGKF
jgi:hypothetical protein